jgi:hypothetical protein
MERTQIVTIRQRPMRRQKQTARFPAIHQPEGKPGQLKEEEDSGLMESPSSNRRKDSSLA